MKSAGHGAQPEKHFLSKGFGDVSPTSKKRGVVMMPRF